MESTGSALLDELNARFELAQTREEKVAILSEYMSPDEARCELEFLSSDSRHLLEAAPPSTEEA